MFHRGSPGAFLGSFYLFVLPMSGHRTGVWVLLQPGRTITVSLMRTAKHCAWTVLTPHLNRRLCDTFLTQKLLSLATLTLLQSNIFFTILGYVEISQHCGWCTSSPLYWGFFKAFLTGLKGMETNVVQGIIWNMAGKKNKNSLIWKEWDTAAETAIRFWSWKT